MKSERDYATCLLSAITKKTIEKNTDLKYSVILSNSAKYGIIPQHVQFDKNIANEENIDRYYVVKVGDFIYNPRISTMAPCGPINQNDCCDGVVSPLYTVFSCNSERVYDKYLKYYFQTSIWHKYIRSIANTGARHDRMNVSDKDFFSISIKLPPIAEQRKIAEILSAQDRVIELKMKLLEEKKRLKKYLCQALLSGKKRIPEYAEPWHRKRLCDIAQRLTVRNTEQCNNVLTISACDGLVSQEAYFTKEVAGKDKSNYFFLLRDDYAYNRSSSSSNPYGAIKRLKKYSAGIVSPLYICFRINSNLVELNYAEYAFDSGVLNKELDMVTQEGARNHGMLNIAVEDFFNCRIELPSYDEQIKIAEILHASYSSVMLQEEELEQEQRKKKALMQQLLTGKVRVSV